MWASSSVFRPGRYADETVRVSLKPEPPDFRKNRRIVVKRKGADMTAGSSPRPRRPRVTSIVLGNERGLLDESVRSTLVQSVADQQILVALPASKLPADIAAFASSDPRVEVVLAPPGTVPAVLLNRCLERARGLFVAFLEEGDRWTKDRLDAQMGWMRRHPEYAVAFARSEGPGSEGGPTVTRPGRKNRDPLRALLPGTRLPLSAAMVRMSALRLFGGFDESPRLGSVADYDLWLRIAAGGHRIGWIEERLTWIAPPVLPHERDLRIRTRKHGVALRRFSKLQQGIPADRGRVVRDSLATAMRALGGMCLAERHRVWSRRYLRDSIRTRPLQVSGYVLFLLSYLGRGFPSRSLRREAPTG